LSNYLNVNIPTFFAGLDEGFLYDGDPSPTNKIVPVEVFAYTSIPQRCGLFSVMTEYGSQHARVPVHYLRSLEVEPEQYTGVSVGLDSIMGLRFILCFGNHFRVLQKP
jgi:hypothetical protein